MDWDLFWSAFGAIGTTVGSMITAIAVVVAVYQYKQPLKKRIRISFSSGIIVFPLDDSDDQIYTINVSNTGIRPVVLTNIYFRVGKNNLVLNNLEHSDLSKPKFPCTLNQEEAVSMHISSLRLRAILAKMIAENKISGRAKIKILVTDTTGGEYFHKTKCKASQIAAIKKKD